MNPTNTHRKEQSLGSTGLEQLPPHGNIADIWKRDRPHHKIKGFVNNLLPLGQLLMKCRNQAVIRYHNELERPAGEHQSGLEHSERLIQSIAAGDDADDDDLVLGESWPRRLQRLWPRRRRRPPRGLRATMATITATATLIVN